MLFTFAEYFLQIKFISLDALSRNSEQIKSSEFLKSNKNLTFLKKTHDVQQATYQNAIYRLRLTPN